ncbi:MAG: hypothetical protein AAF050_01865 [Cyanobacteria bacterium J06649_5]
MGRRIVARRLESTRSQAQVDTYFDKVVKYIPADVVAAWTVASGLIASAGEQVPKDFLLWIAYVFGIVITALWTWRQTQARGLPIAKTQIVIATVAFAIWVAALGGPFESLPSYQRLYGSLLLIAYTLGVGVMTPPEG